LVLLAAAGAVASPVRGSLKLPERSRAAEPLSGYWRVENGVLPVAQAPESPSAVVVLEPSAQAKSNPTSITVELHGLRMEPKLLALPLGTTVVFKNSDRVPHTLYVAGNASIMAPVPTPAGQNRQQQFSTVGEFRIRDEEYPHISAMMVVTASPYTAIVEPSGAFKLEAPEGHYTARVWWHGDWVLTQSVNVSHGAELRLVVAPRKGE
jgi:hypothetical protein